MRSSDKPEPPKLTGKWAEELRGYQLRNSNRKSLWVTVHPDLRMQALHEQFRERETLQAMDRLRLIHMGHKKLLCC
jgi:hypothetical protein